jgi:hypothetical protein
MYPSRWKKPEDRSGRDRLVIEMGNWVNGLAPWKDYATLTFSKECSVFGASRKYERFMRSRLPGVSHFYAIEENPNYMGSNPGSHVHALWVDLGVKRKQVWQEWFKQYGIGRILPIEQRETLVPMRRRSYTDGVAGEWSEPFLDKATDGGMTVADYCAKYVCKDGAWWNAIVQRGRSRAPGGALVLNG